MTTSTGVPAPTRIVSAATAFPAHVIAQDEAVAYLGEVEPRRLRAVARGTAIDRRHIITTPGDLVATRGIEARNAIYRREAPRLAAVAASAVLEGSLPPSAVISSSCTGYGLPSWSVEMGECLGVPCDATRLPLTEAGCAGGVLGIARASDYVSLRPTRPALVVAVELCSLAFHPGGDDEALTANAIFGDGAGAALIAAGPGPGVTVVDSMSCIVPGSRSALGFALTAAGFVPRLSRDLPSVVIPAFARAARDLLRRNGLMPDAAGAWLLHPGGARILRDAGRAMGFEPGAARWSWDALREHGNTSSAAIFDVLERYLGEPRPEGEWCLLAAFGPGVAIELVLGRRTC